LTRLEHLYIGGTAVTDAGLVHLRGLTRLKELKMPRTKATEAGVAALRAALPQAYVDNWDLW
jgi:hypothetical protein